MKKKNDNNNVDVLIVGGGPAGLMAANELSAYKCKTYLIEAMPTIGRKFLMAGKSGLNITTSNKNFVKDYGDSSEWISPMVEKFGPSQIMNFCKSLGQDIFVGSSGRVFPKSMKTSPLLREWLKRLDSSGVKIQTLARWIDLDIKLMESSVDSSVAHKVVINERAQLINARAAIFAFGGASWSKLGSDGKWSPILKKYLNNPETSVIPFTASNMGFRILWSERMMQFEGQPVKSVALKVNGLSRKGEFIITKTGVEGGIIYSLSTSQAKVEEMFELDLLPDLSISTICEKLAKRRRKSTISNFLRKSLGLKGVKFGLFREFAYPYPLQTLDFAKSLKNLKVKVHSSYPLDYAISTKGGVSKHILTSDLMLKDIPGIFCAGEMLDWTAPTGGSLLTGCFSTGSHAGISAAKFLDLKLTN